MSFFYFVCLVLHRCGTHVGLFSYVWHSCIRSHKRYYYRNSTTNEAQWTYPQTDVVGGTEEMELCTTPPPPEQEETPIIGKQ